MGRRGAQVADPDRWVFNRLAGDYRSRPGYPAELVTRLAGLAGAGPVVDLGAGTGLASLPLARRGLRAAVAMLAVLREEASGLPVACVHAAAEETGLPGGEASLVLLADALQWVEPERAGREALRLLAPGGAVAVIEARLGGSPFADGVAALVAGTNPRARPRPEGRLRQFLDAAGAGSRSEERWPHGEALDPDRLEAVLRSLSLVGPALGPDRLEALLADVRALAARCGGAAWTREIRLTWGRTA